MYLSFALSLNILEGMFYWYTDSKDGPSFSQVFDIVLLQDFILQLSVSSCILKQYKKLYGVGKKL